VEGKMSRIAFLVGLLTMLAGCAAGPYMVPVPSPSTAPLTPSPSPSPPEWEGVVLIGEILAQPKEYLGRQVTLTAYYRGWDLFGEAGSGPPLTRSDVAVADATGGIYVVPAGEGAFAGLPRLAPFDRASTEVLLRLSGKVQANAAGQPYVLVSKAEALEGLPAQVLLRARRTGGLAGLDQELMAMADGTLYFLDRRGRTHLRWRGDARQVQQVVEELSAFAGKEVGSPVPDAFSYSIAVVSGQKVQQMTFREGQLPAAADKALEPLREWFAQGMAATATPTPEPPPQAALAAAKALAEQLDIPESEVKIVAWESVDWPDTSLGCPEPGMVYAQVVTPGYQILLLARGESFHAHTDRSGERVAFCFP
jgi:hypothetical protein